MYFIFTIKGEGTNENPFKICWLGKYSLFGIKPDTFELFYHSIEGVKLTAYKTLIGAAKKARKQRAFQIETSPKIFIFDSLHNGIYNHQAEYVGEGGGMFETMSLPAECFKKTA